MSSLSHPFFTLYFNDYKVLIFIGLQLIWQFYIWITIFRHLLLKSRFLTSNFFAYMLQWRKPNIRRFNNQFKLAPSGQLGKIFFCKLITSIQHLTNWWLPRALQLPLRCPTLAIQWIAKTQTHFACWTYAATLVAKAGRQIFFLL